jgi:hypothetical protein
MDREAAVLRAEMSRTRAELDHKLTLLQAKVSDITPRRLTQRYLPEYFVDRVIGGALTLVGLKMAWSQYRGRTTRRRRMRRQLGDYTRW